MNTEWFYQLPAETRSQIVREVWTPVRDAVAGVMVTFWGCSPNDRDVKEVAETAAWTASWRHIQRPH